MQKDGDFLLLVKMSECRVMDGYIYGREDLRKLNTTTPSSSQKKRKEARAGLNEWI